jgi:hypothetical protein
LFHGDRGKKAMEKAAELARKIERTVTEEE